MSTEAVAHERRRGLRAAHPLTRARGSSSVSPLRRARHQVLAVAVILAGLGCGRPRPAPLPVVLGPYDFDRGEVLFAAVTEAMGEAGYPPTRASRAEGRLEAALRTRMRRDEVPPPLVVQLYREGWVSVTVPIPEQESGGRALRARAEAAALAVSISEALAARGIGGAR
ncbi:MAG: hypothetical protein M5U28_15785 [Sandaracinaceae bacterium]|nr:hypothetical protein [Sandaracinaceae bacterium]